MPKRLTADEQADRAMSEAKLIRKVIRRLQEYGFLAVHHPDSRRLVGDKGLPDIIAVRAPHIVAIECKTQVGSRMYPEQTKWQAALDDSGIPVLVVKPADLRVGRLDDYLDGLADAPERR